MTCEISPIACTLTPDDLQQRIAAIRELARSALRAAERKPLTLHLTYDLVAAPRIRELAGQEKSCCAFLDFVVHEDTAGVHLTITAPESARDAADQLFAHFLPDLAALPANSNPIEKEPA